VEENGNFEIRTLDNQRGRRRWRSSSRSAGRMTWFKNSVVVYLFEKIDDVGRAKWSARNIVAWSAAKKVAPSTKRTMDRNASPIKLETLTLPDRRHQHPQNQAPH